MHLFAADMHSVFNLISSGGYAVLFALLFLCGLGLPLPEDVPLIVAGALIARGTFTWPAAAVFGWSGILGGDLILYHFGKRFGRGVVRLPWIGEHLTEKRIDYIEAKFHRYGVAVVAVGRMFAYIRGAMVVVAGTIRFPLGKFILADGAAAIVSGGLFMALGYWLGTQLDDHTIHRFRAWFFAAALALAAICALFVLLRAFHRRRRSADLAQFGMQELPVSPHIPPASFDRHKAGHITADSPADAIAVQPPPQPTADPRV